MFQNVLIAERKTLKTENKDFLSIALSCVVLGVILFISIFVKEFVYVALGLAVFLILIQKNARCVYYILFLIPLMNIFLKDKDSTHLIAILIVEFDIIFFIKYLLDITHKRKKINWVFTVLSVITILYFIFPFTITKITTSLSFLSGFVLVYLLIGYVKDIDFKEITFIYFLGMIFSILIGLFINISPRLLDLCPIFQAGGINRFGASYVNVNVFAGEILIVLALFMILYLKKEIGYSFFVIYPFLLAMCLLTISKFSLIIFALITIIFIIFLAFDKKSLKIKSIDLVMLFVSIALILLIFKKQFLTIMGRLSTSVDKVPGNSIDKPSNLGAGLSDFTTGRWDIWKSYLSVVGEKFKNIFFGLGVDAPYVKDEAPHNTIILFVYYFGVIGTLLYVCSYLCLIRKNLIKKIDVRCLLSIIPVFAFVNYLGFYSCMLSLYLILGFCNIIKKDDAIVGSKNLKKESEFVMGEVKKLNFKLAILTPAFNRAELLKRTYKSLIEQSNKNFVWYIVDDGSTDKTEQVVEDFIKQNKNKKDFKIVYIKKENGGKHTALNTGLKEVKEDYVIILDSDDYLTNDAVETIFADTVKVDNNQDICGLGYLKLTTNGECVGKQYTQDGIVDTFINQRYNKNTYGDKAEVFKTEILKQFPFPEFENEKFVSEATVWCAMSGKYKMMFFNKGIYICEYQEGGLSDGVHKRLFKNPKGSVACYKQLSTNDFRLKLRVKYTSAYIVYSIEAGMSLKEMKENHMQNKFLISLLYLPAKICHKKRKSRFSN